jgi:hypothetical protein
LALAKWSKHINTFDVSTVDKCMHNSDVRASAATPSMWQSFARDLRFAISRSPTALKAVSIASHTVLFAIAAVVLCLGSRVLAQPPQANPKTAGIDEFERLVESLANRNEPPKLAEDAFAINEVSSPPIFGEKYDWVEQRRVREALHVLTKRNGAALWPHLVRHLDDQRYSLTCSFEDCGANLTVGDFCREMARRDLTEPYRRVWPQVRLLPGALGVIHFARPPWRRTLEEWSPSWKDRQLWELQIELGEWGLQRLERPSDTHVELKSLGLGTMPMQEMGMPGIMPAQGPKIMPESEAESKLSGREIIPDIPAESGKQRASGKRDRSRKPGAERIERIQRTKAIIDTIRQTKNPIVDNKHHPFCEQVHFFTEQEASEIREEYLIRISIGAVPTPATKSDWDGSSYLGKTLSEWAILTKHRDAKVRAYAARAFGEIRSDEKSAIPVLLGLLKDEHEPVRAAAASVLGRRPDLVTEEADWTAVVSTLVQLLEASDLAARREATRALGELDSVPKSTIPVLTRLLGDKDANVRVAAAAALRCIGPDAKPAVPVLKGLLNDEDEDVQSSAADALREICGQ